jgi:phosphonopyruvate decarboxylase
MVRPEHFYEVLGSYDVDFFCGVPDSLLKDICAFITSNVPKEKHIITANEGNAIGLAAGYYMATSKIPLVYMQNSGIGNAVNPLLSLTDKQVYNIPLLLMIGWRGEPGKKDEPQHVTQGEVTIDLLETMRIPYLILSDTEGDVPGQIKEAISTIRETNSSYALIIKKGTFSNYSIKNKVSSAYNISREDAIKKIVDTLHGTEVIVSTTGKTSRELFEYRVSKGQPHNSDFLTVGSMGHSSQIALGIALARPERMVICIDGDGALLMHAGGLAIIGDQSPKNLLHIVINNGAHESVGGQPTVGFKIDIPAIAIANGYKSAISVSSIEDLEFALNDSSEKLPALIEVKVRTGSSEDLG